MNAYVRIADSEVVDTICAWNWAALSKDASIDAAWVFYYFAVQLRENLKLACRLFPEDRAFEHLHAKECDTPGLSPWGGVAAPGEHMASDEFLRRTLSLAPIAAERRDALRGYGAAYLEAVRIMDPVARAISVASYEKGAVARVSRAMLDAPDWDDPLLLAFRHFLRKRLARESVRGTPMPHSDVGYRAAPLWMLFKYLLLNCVPALDSVAPPPRSDIATDRNGVA